MSKEDEETYNKMMNTLSKMSHKIEKARTKLNEGAMSDHKAKTDEMTDKLIQSKESSEIVTKENLLTDITECTPTPMQPTKRSSSKSTPKTASSRRSWKRWPNLSRSRITKSTNIPAGRGNS